MDKVTYTIIPTSANPSQGFADLDLASQLSGIHPEMILEFTRAGLLRITCQDRAGDPYFDDEAIYRLRQIEHLRTQQRVHMRTIRMIMQLMDRTEAAERELRWLRERIR